MYAQHIQQLLVANASLSDQVPSFSRISVSFTFHSCLSCGNLTDMTRKTSRCGSGARYPECAARGARLDEGYLIYHQSRDEESGGAAWVDSGNLSERRGCGIGRGLQSTWIPRIHGIGLSLLSYRVWVRQRSLSRSVRYLILVYCCGIGLSEYLEMCHQDLLRIEYRVVPYGVWG